VFTGSEDSYGIWGVTLDSKAGLDPFGILFEITFPF
jgi:hypothetical protein